MVDMCTFGGRVMCERGGDDGIWCTYFYSGDFFGVCCGAAGLIWFILIVIIIWALIWMDWH